MYGHTDKCLEIHTSKCELVFKTTFDKYNISCNREDDDEGDVPPDSDVTYTLELLNVEQGPNISKLTDEQRIELGYDYSIKPILSTSALPLTSKSSGFGQSKIIK
jgi:hypothetical protein